MVYKKYTKSEKAEYGTLSEERKKRDNYNEE
jgi:hypothetical protein